MLVTIAETAPKLTVGSLRAIIYLSPLAAYHWRYAT
jgi:hypothetical protein